AEGGLAHLAGVEDVAVLPLAEGGEEVAVGLPLDVGGGVRRQRPARDVERGGRKGRGHSHRGFLLRLSATRLSIPRRGADSLRAARERCSLCGQNARGPAPRLAATLTSPRSATDPAGHRPPRTTPSPWCLRRPSQCAGRMTRHAPNEPENKTVTGPRRFPLRLRPQLAGRPETAVRHARKAGS